MIRRVLLTVVCTLALGACNSDTPADAPGDTPPEASATPDARPIRGMRAIDRARDASDLASARAVRHDTIR